MNVAALQAQVRAQLESAVIEELSAVPLPRPLKQPEIATLARHAVTAVLRRTTLVQNERLHSPDKNTHTLAQRLIKQAEAIGRNCLKRGFMGLEEAQGNYEDKGKAVQHSLFVIVVSPYGEPLPEEAEPQ